MRIRVRRWLVLGFTLVFIVLAPLLILYGLGYKYNWQKNRLEKTGVFFVKSFPKGADIYLDGIKQKKNTPAQLTRLLPKMYEVKIVQNGFLPWTKNLPIYSQTATFIEDVSLIYEQPKITNLLKSEISEITANSDRDNFIFIDQNLGNSSLWLYETGPDKETMLYSSKVKKPALSGAEGLKLNNWSNSGQKILFKEGDDWLTMNIASPGLTNNLRLIARAQVKTAAWHSQNDNLVYALKGEQLLLFDLLNRSVSAVTKDKISGFMPYQAGVLALAKNLDNFSLKLYLPQETKTLFTLPASASYSFSQSQDGQIALADTNFKLLYLLAPENNSQPVAKLLKNVEGFDWFGQELIYWDNSELWVYFPQFNQETLLERTSQTISRAWWHPNAAYVYAVVGDRLKLYELDSRDNRNVYEIMTVFPEQAGFIFPNKKGDLLYALTTVDGEPGFYQFELQP